MKYVHTDMGRTAFAETFHSLPWLSELPNLEILPLGGKHFKAISAYSSVTDDLPDLTWRFKPHTSGEVKPNANIYMQNWFVPGVLSEKKLPVWHDVMPVIL